MSIVLRGQGASRNCARPIHILLFSVTDREVYNPDHCIRHHCSAGCTRVRYVSSVMARRAGHDVPQRGASDRLFALLCRFDEPYDEGKAGRIVRCQRGVLRRAHCVYRELRWG